MTEQSVNPVLSVRLLVVLTEAENFSGCMSTVCAGLVVEVQKQGGQRGVREYYCKVCRSVHPAPDYPHQVWLQNYSYS